MSAVKVAVTGSAGQIGYSLLFRIASGAVFGSKTLVQLQLLEIEPALPALQGVKMELDDCAFPLLKEIVVTADASEAFYDTDWIFLVGAAPRKAGMERNDLLRINGDIFVVQGKAINENAGESVKILVVGNPCNTNCMIAMSHAPRISKNQWFAMTALDENRAKRQLAQKADVDISDVKNLCIWGNHSSTQYPDFYNSTIQGKPVSEVIQDENWLKVDFIKTVQQRGASIINARGASSAASAANAVIDTIHRLNQPTVDGEWFSTCVPSDGSYGIPEGLVFSYPLRSKGKANYEIIQGLELNEFGQQHLDATLDELEKEKEIVHQLLG